MRQQKAAARGARRCPGAQRTATPPQRIAFAVQSAAFLAAWVSIFVAGATISTAHYRSVLTGFDPQKPQPPAERTRAEAKPPAATTAEGDAPAEQETIRAVARWPARLLDAEFAQSAPTSPGNEAGAATAEKSPSAATGKPVPRETLIEQPVRSAVAFLITLTAYTPPNLALLCTMAGVLGALSRRLAPHDRHHRRTTAMERSLAAPMLRGFCIFVSILAGVLVLTGDPFANTTPDQYLRLAGTGSLMAFAAGFNPRFVAHLLNRVATLFGDSSERKAAS